MRRPSRATHPNGNAAAAQLSFALAWFVLWTLATWLLEGRVQTFLRPEASFDRLLYTGIANIAIGQIGALTLLALLFRGIGAEPPPVRLRPLKFRSLSLIAALLVGLGFYAIAGGRFDDTVALTNAFAQVFVVSAAEVIVCWGLLGVAVEYFLRPHLGAWSAIGAASSASVAFGLYHFAHSPPFNTPSAVVFLTMVGLVTSLFFFVTRDLVATIVFHNFPAVAGVTRALAERGEMETLGHAQPLLLATAAISLVVVLIGERLAFARDR